MDAIDIFTVIGVGICVIVVAILIGWGLGCAQGYSNRKWLDDVARGRRRWDE